MIENKKASIILVLNVLKEYSDDDHFLTHQNIIDKIQELYNIELERKSIASSISLLQELDYDIVKSPKGGFALVNRTFIKSEAQFIVDSLFSSKSINGKMAYELANRVNSCLSKYQRKDYNYNYKAYDVNRSKTSEILLNLEIIEEAKKLGKRISFQYLYYNEDGKLDVKFNGFRYIVSPYYQVNSNGKYYLICNYREKYNPIQIFKFDYMVNVKVEDTWPIKPINDVLKGEKFDLAKYLNDNIYLLDGEVINAVIEIENHNTIPSIIDNFGDNAKIYKKDDKLYASIRSNENALFYWYMQYSENLKIVSPISLIEKVKNEALHIIKKYSD